MKNKLPELEDRDDSKEYLVSLFYKSAAITVYMDYDGEYVPVVRAQNETKDRGYPERFATIDKAVKFAKKKIDEIA